MTFQESRLMRMIGSALICTSLVSISGCSNELDYKTKQEIDKKIEASYQEGFKMGTIKATDRIAKMNPLENREVYEIPTGKYTCHLEDKDSCFPPFHSFSVPVGKVYLVRTDSDNSFKKPVKAQLDLYDQFQFELGKYQVWVENKGFFAPVDEFEAREKTGKAVRLKVYELKEPKPPEILIPSTPTPDIYPTPAPAPAPKPSANPSPLMPAPSHDRTA